jgi:predicted DNA-binding transcriptional regulator AlpA
MTENKLEKLLVDFRELRALGIPYTREHVTRLCRQGRFPKPIRLGGDDQSCKAFWRYADILAWIEARAEATPKLPTRRPSAGATVGQNAESPANTAPMRKARAPGQHGGGPEARDPGPGAADFRDEITF